MHHQYVRKISRVFHMFFADGLKRKPSFSKTFCKKAYLILRQSPAKTKIADTSRASLRLSFIKMLWKIVEVFLSVQILSSLKSPYSKHNRLPLQTGFDKTLMR